MSLKRANVGGEFRKRDSVLNTCLREEKESTMDSSPIRGLILFVAVLILNFIMYCFGEASQDVNESELEEKASSGNKKAKRLLKIVDSPRRFITTVQLTGTAVAMLVGYYQTRIYGTILSEILLKHIEGLDVVVNVVSYIAVAVAILVILLTIGVVVPQLIGRKNPDKWAWRLEGIVCGIVKLLTPVTVIITFLAKIILKIFGIEYNENEENVTEEEIISIVNEGQEQGVLEEQEAEMISNIMELDEKDASKIMTHRTNIVAIDGNQSLKEVVEFIIDEANSRFPVYDEDIDNIIGIVHIRDVFTCYYKGDMSDKPIKELKHIIREPKFIPESRNIDTLFEEMQNEKNHMVIVVDEYGQTAGILTMEDILEEIVGNIFDEYDEEDTNIVKEDENVYLIKGVTPLEDIEDELDIKFDDDDYDTLNGYLISKLDRIPSVGDNIVIDTDECKFDVLAIEGKMISLVRVTVLEKKESVEESA